MILNSKPGLLPPPRPTPSPLATLAGVAPPPIGAPSPGGPPSPRLPSSGPPPRPSGELAFDVIDREVFSRARSIVRRDYRYGTPKLERASIKRDLFLIERRRRPVPVDFSERLLDYAARLAARAPRATEDPGEGITAHTLRRALVLALPVFGPDSESTLVHYFGLATAAGKLLDYEESATPPGYDSEAFALLLCARERILRQEKYRRAPFATGRSRRC
jgi:hypothetical protein